MHEKIILFGITLMLLTGCVSSRTSQSVIEHQREIDRVEEGIRIRDRAIESSIERLEAITARSSGMEGTVDELIELFDEYQRAVEQLIRDYRAAESTDKGAEESNSHNTIYIILPAASQDSVHNSVR